MVSYDYYTGLVFYRNFVPKAHRFSIFDFEKCCDLEIRVIGTDTDRSATYDFLLTLYSNHGPISYRFRDKR